MTVITQDQYKIIYLDGFGWRNDIMEAVVTYRIKRQNRWAPDTIPNLIETLRRLDGSNPKEIAPAMYLHPDSIRQRVLKLERVVGGEVLERPLPKGGNTHAVDAAWHITPLGKRVLADNEEVA